jgi:cysteine desulfurase
LSAMLPYLAEHFGNPSGSHAVARRARDAVEEARERMAPCLGCDPSEIVFTSGGTEACNLAVVGAHRAVGGEVLCSAFEHHAVLDACAGLGGRLVPVLPSGVVDLGALAAMLGGQVGVVSIMLANNEVGTLQPLAEVVELVRRLAPGAVVHTDAVAGAPWVDLATAAAGADLVSLGAHKFGGPKGVGALVVRAGTPLEPVLYGGPQERERRPGTHHVAGIVGMAAALETTAVGLPEEGPRVGALRSRLLDGLRGSVPGTFETAPGADKVPGSCHVRFEGTEQEELLVLLDDMGVCASAASACASGALEPSHVLRAMGMSAGQAREAVRFSLGWASTDEDVALALDRVPKAVERLRAG